MKSGKIIVDVREPSEYAQSHAAGAINVPPAELISEPNALSQLPKDTEIILYCRTGNRSNAAIQILAQRGFTNLINGINAGHVTKRYLS